MPERLYTITAQRPTTIITATNRVIDGIELHVEGPGDIAFVIQVPADANRDFVDRAIRERLNKHLDLGTLGSE